MKILRLIRGFLFAILIIITQQLFCQTNVSGIISTNTTWTKAGSPYYINGNTEIETNATLTLMPGTSIIFNGDYFIQALGNIIAIGNSQDSIYFQTASLNNQIGQGIYIRPSSTSFFDNSYNYISGSIFKYCSFKNFYRAVYFWSSGIAIQNCSFIGNNIAFEPRSSQQSLISNSSFFNNNNGLYITSGYSYAYADQINCVQDLMLRNNDFENNQTPIYVGLNQRTIKNFKITFNC